MALQAWAASGLCREVAMRGHAATWMCVLTTPAQLEPHHQTQLSFDLTETLSLCFYMFRDTLGTSAVPAV